MIDQVHLLSMVYGTAAPSSRFQSFDAASFKAADPREMHRAGRALSSARQSVDAAVAVITGHPAAVPCCMTK